MTEPGAAPAAFGPALSRLFIVQFFSWSAMFALWIYAVPIVAANVLHLPGAGPRGLQPAIVTVGLCFSAYAALGTTGSLLLPRVIARFGHARVHGLALLCGAAGLAIFGMAREAIALVPAVVAIGIGWAAIGSIPYAVLAGLVPPGRGAHFTRLFAFSTVIPQVATTIGLVMLADRFLAGKPERVMALAAVAMGLAGVLTLVWRRHFAPADLVEAEW
ncbi:MAG: hypothetical protein KGL48_00460 [Sphingomonadales bacterium]|nr:hypothetical protein [Sphingomonadales bacterium]MDE2567879.1 hypothetical protein [Sphingomonadales bacterium]